MEKERLMIAPAILAGLSLTMLNHNIAHADTVNSTNNSVSSVSRATTTTSSQSSTVTLKSSSHPSVSDSSVSSSSTTNNVRPRTTTNFAVKASQSNSTPNSSSAANIYSNKPNPNYQYAPVKTQAATPAASSSSSATRANNSSSSVTLNANGQKLAQAAGLNSSQLNANEINALNQATYHNRINDGQMTYKEYRQYAQNVVDEKPQYAIPQFDPNKIQNLPAATTKDARTSKTEALDIWDSWPVVKADTGVPVNYHGYQMVVGMMGYKDDWNDGHLYLLYNKYGDQNFNDWKCAGPIFGFNASDDFQHWSGSTIVNPDGSLQLFYTLDDHTSGNNDQQLASATVDLNYGPDGITIKDVRNNHVLFKGDGYYYQTYDQWKDGKDASADDYCLRDPHVIDVNGKRYLVFEGNTGTYNYQGIQQIYDLDNYGENTIGEDVQDMLKVVNNPSIYSKAALANACIGLMELGGNAENPTVAKLYAPIVSTPLVSDEIERPVIVPINGKYYLFTDTRLNRGIMDDLNNQANQKIGDNVGMLGFVADSLDGNYLPLNGNGTVLTASTGAKSRTSEYSWYAVPMPNKQGGNSQYVLITAYMSNRDEAAGAGKNSTWGPSFVVKINPDGTTEVLQNSVTSQQGIWHDFSPVEFTSHQAIQAPVAPQDAQQVQQNGHWYLRENGKNLTGFQYLPAQHKTVYYNPQNGQMEYGLQKIDGQYYDFDPTTGALLFGYQNVNGHEVYCDPVTGMILKLANMQKVGKTSTNNGVDITAIIKRGAQVATKKESTNRPVSQKQSSTHVSGSVNATASVSQTTYATRKAEYQSHRNLPQTGEQTDRRGLIALLGLLGGFVGLTKRRKED